MKYNISPRAFYRIMRYYINEIQYLAKSLYRITKISYMNEYNISPRAFYRIMRYYINEIQYLAKSQFIGLQDIIYEKLQKKFFSTPHIIQKIFYCLIFNIPHFFIEF